MARDARGEQVRGLGGFEVRRHFPGSQLLSFDVHPHVTALGGEPPGIADGQEGPFGRLRDAKRDVDDERDPQPALGHDLVDHPQLVPHGTASLGGLGPEGGETSWFIAQHRDAQVQRYGGKGRAVGRDRGQLERQRRELSGPDPGGDLHTVSCQGEQARLPEELG